MRDSLPYMIAKLEQGEADETDIKYIRGILEYRVGTGAIDPGLYKELVQYVDNLEERQQ